MRMSHSPLDKLLLEYSSVVRSFLSGAQRKLAILVPMLVSLLIALGIPSLSLSDEEVNRNDFVVTGAIYKGEETKPWLQSTTVFHGYRAYDQLADSPKLAIFDFDQRKVMLADQRRKLRTHISFQSLLRCQTSISRKALSLGGLAAFLASPKFVREFDGSGSITLRSPWLTYKAEGRQSASDVVGRFLDFADWSARLANLESGSPYPAQARIELNKELRSKNWQVTRVTRTPGPREPNLVKLRCDRKYQMHLGASEQNFIREAEKALENFEPVEFSDYVGIEKTPRVASKK